MGPDEQTLSLEHGLTLVGPNNSGKTNLLKAIQFLFTGWDNSHAYSQSADLTFGDRRVKTSFLATFDGDDSSGSNDSPIYDALDNLHQILGTRRSSSTFTLSLQFTASNTPVYQFFPNAKQPDVNALRTQFSRTQRQLVVDLLSRFACHYVPSARSMRELYEELLVPFLRKSAALALAPHSDAISTVLQGVAESFNGQLSASGLTDLQVSFELPNGSLEDLLQGFDFYISDPEKTTIFRKGQGIQSTALLAGFMWMTAQLRQQGKEVVWLLEEPESYLHPELSQSALTLLERLRQQSLLVVTTHALAFVPQDPALVAGTSLEANRTRVEVFPSYVEATARLRTALGVRFSDYFNLGRYNLLLEGKTDRQFIDWVLQQIPREVHEWSELREAHLLDFGGVRHLGGFVRATYGFISAERACVCVFDGDDAGEKERRDLQQYLGNKSIPFEANRNFLSVRDRFAVEGLFPDAWVEQLHNEHAGWFETYSVDVTGQLEPYKIRDGRKSDAGQWLMSCAEREPDLQWADRWVAFCLAANNALRALHVTLTARATPPAAQGSGGIGRN